LSLPETNGVARVIKILEQIKVEHFVQLGPGIADDQEDNENALAGGPDIGPFAGLDPFPEGFFQRLELYRIETMLGIRHQQGPGLGQVLVWEGIVLHGGIEFQE
jgi:hypothetical protein